MRTRILLVAALALLLGVGLFAAAPRGEASANYGSYHCVKYGETLSGIAAMYGTTAWAIAKANGIHNPNYIRAGTCLVIPSGYHGGYQPPMPVHHGGYHPPMPPAPMPVHHGGYYPKPPAYGGWGAGWYCLKYGDTLSGVGAMYGVSAWSIAYANGIHNPNYVRAGTCVRIPGH